jgi:hypothetical protein
VTVSYAGTNSKLKIPWIFKKADKHAFHFQWKKRKLVRKHIRRNSYADFQIKRNPMHGAELVSC